MGTLQGVNGSVLKHVPHLPLLSPLLPLCLRGQLYSISLSPAHRTQQFGTGMDIVTLGELLDAASIYLYQNSESLAVCFARCMCLFLPLVSLFLLVDILCAHLPGCPVRCLCCLTRSSVLPLSTAGTNDKAGPGESNRHGGLLMLVIIDYNNLAVRMPCMTGVVCAVLASTRMYVVCAWCAVHGVQSNGGSFPTYTLYVSAIGTQKCADIHT